MEISDILDAEVKRFFASEKTAVFITGGSQNKRHEVANYFREQTFGHYFVYEFGSPPSFERADPYILNLDFIPQEFP